MGTDFPSFYDFFSGSKPIHKRLHFFFRPFVFIPSYDARQNISP
jgi:hypothetical protein